MNRLLHMALVSGLVLCSALPLAAQVVYRCGDSYSQAPCEGGRAVDTSDARSAEDRRRADAATREAQDSANRLEKERLQAEALRPVAAAPRPLRQVAVETDKAVPKVRKKKASKRREADYFTAAGPAAVKEKKAAKAPATPPQ